MEDMGYKQLNVQVPAGLADRFDRVVKKDGRTKTWTVVGLITDFTDMMERQQERAGSAEEGGS